MQGIACRECMREREKEEGGGWGQREREVKRLKGVGVNEL